MEGSAKQFCTSCGTPVEEGVSFCGKCGTDMRGQQPPPLPPASTGGGGIIREELRSCPLCGEVVGAEVTFCTKCGADMTAPVQQPRQAPPPRPQGQQKSGGGGGTTFIIILPRIIGAITAILIVVSCFLPWMQDKENILGFDFVLESFFLPICLIIANVFLAILILALISTKTQWWFAYLLVALYALALEFYYFGAGPDFSEWTFDGAFDYWNLDMEVIKYAAIGFYLNFAGAILLILNIIFAPMSRRAAFRRYVDATSSWDY